MEVTVTNLRANLKQWLDRVRAGEEVVITDRGIPVARLTAIGSSDDKFEELIAAGVIVRAQRPKSKLPKGKPPKLRGGVSILDYLER